MHNKYVELEEKMQKPLTHLLHEFDTLRVGRANPAVLGGISVSYYGTPTPLSQVATISVPEPQTLSISPWDSSLVKEIEKAILKSELGINPNNDGKTIRLNFPPLTEERRKDLVKTVGKKAEEAKIAVRAARRDAIELYKAMKKKSEITEDDLKEIEEDIQELTDKYIKNIEKEAAKKEKDVMQL